MVAPSRIVATYPWKSFVYLGVRVLLFGYALFFLSQEYVLPSTLSGFTFNTTSNVRGTKSLESKMNIPFGASTTNIYKSHSDSRLEPISCSELLHRYRSGQIHQTNQASAEYPIDKSYITRSNTDRSFLVSVHDKTIDYMRFGIFESGEYYENVISNVIADIISRTKNDKHAVMLDVGANIGWFSLLAASYGAEVFAFEPNVINMVRFCESQLLNGWSLAQNSEQNNLIHSYLKGVGSIHGQSLSMYTPDPNNPGSHTFVQDLAKDHFVKRNTDGDLQTLDGGKLPIVTLDALAKDQGWLSTNKPIEIALMKMDIEGMERVALDGAQKLLKTNIIENILIEFNADSSRADWVSLLESLFSSGYTLFKIGDHRGPDIPFQLISSDIDSVIDDIKRRPFSEAAGGNVNAWFKVKKKRAGR